VRIRKLPQQQPPLLIQLSCRQGNVRQAQRRPGWLVVAVVVVVVGKELELGVVVAVDKVLAKVLATVESVAAATNGKVPRGQTDL
jgi:hypothetical protein